MHIGPFEINFIPGKKSYRQLVQMIEREKRSSFEDPKTTPIKQLKEYKSWVYSAVTLIRDRISTVPYRFYRKDTEEEITSRLHSYKIFSKPFSQPNPLMSFRFIKSFCQTQLDLCGMTCTYKALNNLNQPWELWPLNMNDFLGIYDSNGNPIEVNSQILPSDVIYIFMIGGKQYEFSNSELIILTYPHPYRPYYGASPIQSQAYAVDTQTYIEIYERDFFANSARVDMILKTEQDVSKDKADEIRQRWLEKYNRRFHDIAVLGSGLEPVPLKFTNKDFEFMNLAQWTKDMVLSAYRINPQKLGNSENTNRSSSVQVDIDFNRDCIQPKLTLWDEEYTKEVLMHFDDRIEMRHDNPIPRDRQIEVQEGRVQLAGIPSLTIDEYRKRTYKYGHIEGGDELLIPSTYIPVSMLKKFVEARIKQMTAVSNRPNLQSQTDPARHDGDTPHVNPDGSDDRDQLPTSGRNFEDSLKKWWFKSFDENTLLFFNEKTTVLFFKSLLNSAIATVIKYSGIELNNDNWIELYSEKSGIEFYKTLWKQGLFFDENNNEKEKYVKDQISKNPRLSKICNSTLKSCINYVRFKYLENFGLKKVWKINSNNCGHKGRIKEFETDTIFKLGDSEIRFPGEIFNLNCDCEIEMNENKLLLLGEKYE